MATDAKADLAAIITVCDENTNYKFIWPKGYNMSGDSTNKWIINQSIDLLWSYNIQTLSQPLNTLKKSIKTSYERMRDNPET